MKTAGVRRLQRQGPPGVGLDPLDLDPADFQSDVPEQTWHLYHEDEDAGLYVGVWTTTDMHEAFGPYPGDEFMIILEGDVEILDADGAATRISAGQRFAVKNGSPVSWKQVGFCRKFFVIHAPPGVEAGPHDTDVRILNPERLAGAMTDAPSHAPEFAARGSTGFANAAGTMNAGLGETGSTGTGAYRVARHQLVEVLDGTLDLQEPGGEPQSFGPGDVFFVLAGTQCNLTADGPVRFLYCAVDPLSQGAGPA